MFGFLGTIKTYGLAILGGLLAVAIGVAKYRGSKIEGLKQKATMKELKAKVRQNVIVSNANRLAAAASKEGQKIVEDDLKDARRGNRRRFD